MALSFDSNHTNLSIPFWIDGKEEPGLTTFDVINPVSNETCWTAASATQDDALRAVKSADEAFVSWSKTIPAHRMEILLKTPNLLENNNAQYAGYMATEMGVEVPVAQFFMLPLAVSILRDIAGRTVSLCVNGL
jgi:acyl-CoA reductase-like NAD-dependent aldehyde dehydrogenase